MNTVKQISKTIVKNYHEIDNLSFKCICDFTLSDSQSNSPTLLEHDTINKTFTYKDSANTWIFYYSELSYKIKYNDRFVFNFPFSFLITLFSIFKMSKIQTEQSFQYDFVRALYEGRSEVLKEMFVYSKPTDEDLSKPEKFSNFFSRNVEKTTTVCHFLGRMRNKHMVFEDLYENYYSYYEKNKPEEKISKISFTNYRPDKVPYLAYLYILIFHNWLSQCFIDLLNYISLYQF